MFSGYRTRAFRALGLAVWTLGFLLVAAGARAETDTLPPPLPDQFGDLRGLEPSVPQVVIVLSAKRLRRLKPWEQAIRSIDASIPILRVADVPRTAPTRYEDVARTLRRRLPADLAVAIDLDGVWAATYQLDPMLPNVLVFEAGGRLLARHVGFYRKELRRDLEASLRRVGGSQTEGIQPP